MTTTNDRGEAIPTAPVFNRDDMVTVDGGPTVYTVVTLHSYGKDVLVRQNANHSGTWVSIDQVAHVQVDQ